MNIRTTLTLAGMALLMSLRAESAILAYYPFDADFNDASGNGNHLRTVEGTPSITSATGSFIFGGGALDTMSTVGDRSYLELSDPITFGNEDPWSIAFWARRRAGSDDRQGMIIGDTVNIRDFIWLSNNPSQVQGMRFRSSDNSNFNYDAGPDDGGWHHWALAADGNGGLTVYRDNILLGSRSATTNFSVKNVAHGYNTNVHSMNGQIDELHIYDEEIDAAQVEALFLGTGAAEFKIVEIEYMPGEGSVTLTWSSREGEGYAVRASRDLTSWNIEFDDLIAADEGEQTTRIFSLEALGLSEMERLYIRVERL